MIGAVRVGLIAGGIAFAWLLAHAEPVTSRCVPLVGQPGATVCGGRADEGIAWAAAAPTMEVVVAEPLPATSPASTQPKWQIPSCRELWPAFVAAGREFGVDPVLVQIVGLVESGCGQAQSSPAGAQGVMQVMPSTAAGLDPAPDWRTNEAENIRLGARYLAAAMRTYGEPESRDPDYARAIRLTSLAYNGGPGMALREIQGKGIATESAFHARWVTGMWSERHNDRSLTLEDWCGMTRWCNERGGQ